eukprot:3039047-Rhodomonas_salina.1
MSGTDLHTRYAMSGQAAICLRVSYAMSGTDLLSVRTVIFLGAHYAMSSTDLQYATTRSVAGKQSRSSTGLISCQISRGARVLVPWRMGRLERQRFARHVQAVRTREL